MDMWADGPPGAKTRLAELARLYDGTRAVYFDIAHNENNWTPSLNSPLERDLDNVENGPAGPWGDGPVRQVVGTVGGYFLAAVGHLGGLAALHVGHEVLFSPGPLVRAILENCARIMWVLAPDDPQGTRVRVARGYLEELLSAEQVKTVVGRLADKSNDRYRSASADYRALRDTLIPGLFMGATRADLGEHTLDGQRRLRLEECVKWMYERTSAGGTGISADQGVGLYGFLCSMTHPTLYPARELTLLRQRSDGTMERYLRLDLDLLGKLAGAAITTFYSAFSLLMWYFGWVSPKKDEWEGLIEAVLPGTLVGRGHGPRPDGNTA